MLAILPISIAFHASHYLTALLVNGQYALGAISDPFATGIDLLLLGHGHVTVSFLSNYDGVRAIWHAQTAIIVTGHVLAVAVGHVLALQDVPATRGARPSASCRWRR